MRSLGVLAVAGAVLSAGLLLSGCTGDQPAARPGSPRDAAVVRALPAERSDSAVSLEQALSARRSVREFTSSRVTNEQLGQLLWAAQGVTAATGARTAPSAGALYPLEVYAVRGDEVWHYRPRDHRAAVWRDPTVTSRVATAVGQDAARDAPLLIVVTAVPSRTEEKYGDRAERYVLMEVGHATQNLLLQATALGLGAVTIGAFDDQGIASALALPAGEYPYYVVPVGVPDA